MQYNRPKPISEGNFAKTPFAHILVYLMNKQLSGTLEINDQFNTINIYFRTGMPAKVTTTITGKLLGQVLLDMGKISADQLVVTQKEMAVKGGLQGQILLEKGFITAAELVSGITRQMMLKLVDAFAMTDASYAFYERVNLLTGAGPAELIQLDTYSALMVGARIHNDSMSMEGVLGALKDKIFYLNNVKTLSRFNLTKSERVLCRLLLEQPRSLEELENSTSVDMRTVRTTLYVFLITRILRVKKPGEKGSNPPAPEERKLDSIAPPAKGKTSYPPQVQAFRDEIQAKAAQIAAQNYFEMLGVSVDAPADEARKAFFMAAKTFHPDKASSPELIDLKETLEFIFTNLSEAHSTLIDPDAREEYEAAINSGSARTSMMPESTEETKVREILEAETLFQKALVLMRRQKFDQAYEYMDKAHTANPNEGEYIATWAYLKMLLFNKENPADLLPHFRAAEELSPNSERVHLLFGYLLKKAGRMGEAKGHFQKVLEIKPSNIEAGRELRILQMRENKDDSSKKKGFLSKFLK